MMHKEFFMNITIIKNKFQIFFFINFSFYLTGNATFFYFSGALDILPSLEHVITLEFQKSRLYQTQSNCSLHLG